MGTCSVLNRGPHGAGVPHGHRLMWLWRVFSNATLWSCVLCGLPGRVRSALLTTKSGWWVETGIVHSF